MQDPSFRDRAAFVPGPDALVVADVHVGRDETSGVEFPLGERADLCERLVGLLAHFDPDVVVFAGDVLHSFSRVTSGVEAEFEELVRCCRASEVRPVVVVGNHDTLLAEVWDGPLHDAYRLSDGTVVCHGHEEPAERGTRYVVGHDHPAIEIEGRRRACFLYGDDAYRDADVLMLPAFNRLAVGMAVNRMRAADFQSPLVSDADVFRPIVYDPASHETLHFPPLGKFRRML